MFDFNEDGPAPVGASLRFLNRSRPYMRLFSLSQHHLLHLVGNSQNKWACNYSPRVWWWLLSCTPRPKKKKKKITIEWICNQTIQKRHKEKKEEETGDLFERFGLAFDYCWPAQLDYKERDAHIWKIPKRVESHMDTATTSFRIIEARREKKQPRNISTVDVIITE
jgi:hypothetical protein